MTRDAVKKLALSAGAKGAEYVAGGNIVLSDEFRRMCESNSCGKYGKCYVCPPYVGEIDKVMDDVRRFPGGILYQTVCDIEDSFDIEGMETAWKQHCMLSQRIQELMKSAYAGEMLHLTCGGCGICERCAAYEGEPCRFPDKALPSMESYGIDVYRTSTSTTLKYINGQNTVTYFGIILLPEFEDV